MRQNGTWKINMNTLQKSKQTNFKTPFDLNSAIMDN